MGIWDRLKAELVDIVEWLDPSNDTMMHRFERYGNEIKYGAKLIVREVPVLTTLLGWKHGFHSPFKAEVYFASMRRFTDLKWGTQNPIMLRDAEFGPVRLRAFGTYVVRVADPGTFVKEIVGTDAHFTTDEISDQLRNVIVSRFTDILGEGKIPILDLAANYDEMGAFITTRIQPEFERYGLEMTKLLVENISLPPAVEEALDKRSSMGVIGDLAKYTQFQTAEAMRDAAANPGGMAAGGMGMGMGFAMANQMGQAMAPTSPTPPGQSQPGPAATPPPVPTGRQYHVAVGSQQTGPFDMATIKRKITAGELTPETLVWSAGMASWQAAGEIADLQSAFGATPPPLPPS